MEPFIGIIGAHDTRKGRDRYYVEKANLRSVAEAGGVPVVIAPAADDDKLEAALGLLSGVLLPGGVDVDPALYGEEPLPGLGRVDPEWDALDVAVARWALAKNIPVLGICRGMQVLNVAAGGTLWQDIPSQVTKPLQHAQKAPRDAATHGVATTSGSRLQDLLGAQFRVNSFHHQAVKDVAPGFVATAEAADGIVEGIEGESRSFAVGVQWHPELLIDSAPAQRELFRAFVQAAVAYAVKRAHPGERAERGA